MASPPLPELSDRARDIFRLVVEAYLDSGHPIGSKTIAGNPAINLSPASIRSVLADLERAGLLAAPHTSAGRIPTNPGLRLFVDGMMQLREPSEDERAVIEQRVADAGPIEQALEQTSAMLSELSGAAGIVIVPRREVRVAQMNLIALGERRVLAVLVSEDGGVENRILELEADISVRALEQAGNYVTSRLGGRSLAEAAKLILRELNDNRTALDEASRDLVARGLATWSQDSDERPILIVRGQANLLDEAAMQDLDRVRQLLDDLERRQSFAQIIDQVREAKAARIFIGAENRLFGLSGSSVIASPYRDREGEVLGAIGVIGPTRLNYARLVPMVEFTARSLGRLIE